MRYGFIVFTIQVQVLTAKTDYAKMKFKDGHFHTQVICSSYSRSSSLTSIEKYKAEDYTQGITLTVTLIL